MWNVTSEWSDTCKSVTTSDVGVQSVEVITRSRVWPQLWVGFITCCSRHLSVRMSFSWTVLASEGTSTWIFRSPTTTNIVTGWLNGSKDQLQFVKNDDAATLLPERTANSLQDCSYNHQLPTHASSLKDNNFLIRMLFEDICFTMTLLLDSGRRKPELQSWNGHGRNLQSATLIQRLDELWRHTYFYCAFIA